MPATKTATKTVKTERKPATKTVARTLAGTVLPQDDARNEILEKYQTAVTFMQQGDYTAAHPALESLLKTAPPEFTDRIRMYLSACIAQATKADATFSSPEEKYDYAISLLNDGQYEDAREHLHEILADDVSADYAFYGLAVLASMTGDTQTCLDHLTEAIKLNTMNRIQARSDSDFQDMNDDPRFTELLYPEA
ncbi:MAG: TPR end-of-group domain-containing protein [Janthinobacterium lividum]